MTTATYTNKISASFNGVNVRNGDTFFVTKIKGTNRYRFQRSKSRQTVAFTSLLSNDWAINAQAAN